MYNLSNLYKIEKFQDGEIILQHKNTKDIIILNETASYILDLLLKYDIIQAKEHFISSFTNNNKLNIKSLEEDFNTFVQNYEYHKIIIFR